MIARLRLFYLFYYAGVGTFLSYFAPYLRGLGFTGAEIGAVTMAQQLVAAPAALLWGSLADRLGVPTRALKLCTLGALAATASLPFARTPLQVGLCLVFTAACSGAVVPLVDTTTVGVLQQHPGKTYARTRLFGSVGFVLTAQGLGLLLALRGDRPADPLMPLSFLACVAGYALLAQGFPAVPRSVDRPHWRDALALLRNRRLLFLIAVSTLHWGACAPYHLLFGVLVRDRGLPSSLTGLSLSLGVAAEVLVLFAFPLLERRLSLRALLAIACAGTALRWLLLARADSAKALVLLQLFHGLTFGLWWGCAIEGLSRAVPARLRATGQALFSAVVFGAGNALGYGLAGRAYDRFGSVSPLFLGAALVEALALCLLFLPLTPEPVRA